jgi:hypothetical protein
MGVDELKDDTTAALTSMYGKPPVTCWALGGGMLQGTQWASCVEVDVQVSLNMPMGQPLVLHA